MHYVGDDVTSSTYCNDNFCREANRWRLRKTAWLDF